MKAEHAVERLKDRRDYRATLIEKRNTIDVKISKVEQEIRNLKPGGERAKA